VTGRFVSSGAVAYESGELYNGQIRDIGILYHSPDDTPSTECAASGTASKDLGGLSDAFGANRAVTVAAKESQRAPPRVSMRATMAIRRRKPRAQSGPWKRG
jgi:hypothetical protein